MVRPTQQSSTKRKRKSNDLIWARDGDHKNAQEHPCYLLENNCNKGAPSDNNDKVWVEWSSNGTIACIPKSRISTTVLSSRRSRRNDTKQTGDEQTATNKKQKKRAPSKKRSSKGQSKPINDNNNATLNEDEDKQQKKRAPPRKRLNGGLSTLLSKRKKHTTVGNSSNTTNAIPKQILVEECGVPEVNGTYDLRVDDARTDGLSVDESDAPVYSKKGIWQGTAVDFEIYRTASRLGYGHSGILVLDIGCYHPLVFTQLVIKDLLLCPTARRGLAKSLSCLQLRVGKEMTMEKLIELIIHYQH